MTDIAVFRRHGAATVEKWETTVSHAEVTLGCRWPRGLQPRVLRGAVSAQVDDRFPGGAGAEWHNHDDDGSTCNRAPRTLYRIGNDNRPRVWIWGPTAHERAQWLAAEVHALRLPSGQVLQVTGAELRRDTTRIQVCGKHAYRYELVTPLFPSWVAYARRPRTPGPERWWWSGHVLTVCIDQWMRAAGHDTAAGQHRIHVHMGELDDGIKCVWERPEQGRQAVHRGFRARFVANVILPDGVGLGRHRAEGWGEVRRVK